MRMLMASDSEKSAVQVWRQFMLGLMILHFVYGRWRRDRRRRLVARRIDWPHNATACGKAHFTTLYVLTHERRVSFFITASYLAFAEQPPTATGGKKPPSVVRNVFPLSPRSPLPGSMASLSPFLLPLLPLSLPKPMWKSTATSAPYQPILNWITHPPLSIPALFTHGKSPLTAEVALSSPICISPSLTLTYPLLLNHKETSAPGPEAVADETKEVGVGEASGEGGGGEEEEKIEEFFTVGTALWHNSQEETITGFYFFPITDAWCASPDSTDTTSSLSSTDEGMCRTGGEDPALPALPAPCESKSSVSCIQAFKQSLQ
ncbi:hypothetical protein ECG_09726 [Echinococcus granulosus]|nr:hypothetical protein ECG_09726 [Echinococcus granulosus]